MQRDRAHGEREREEQAQRLDEGRRAVAVDEHATDCEGHPRIALVHDDGPTRTELIIDPVDGTFAGERDTLRSDARFGLPAGSVISTTAVGTAVVDGPGLRPEASTA